MSKKITFIVISLLTTFGCSHLYYPNNTTNDYQVSPIEDISEEDVFHLDPNFNKIVLNNTLIENIELLNEIDKENSSIHEIKTNEKYSDSYQLLINKIKNQKLYTTQMEKKVVTTITPKTEDADITTANNTKKEQLSTEDKEKELELIFKKEEKEANNQKSLNDLPKKEIITVDNKEKYNSFYKDNKKLIDKKYYSIKSYCNVEDSYLLPDSIKDFKEYIQLISNNDEKLEEFIYSKYYKEIFECKKIYNSNKLLKESNFGSEVIKEPKTIDTNLKTSELIKELGYDSFNFKEPLINVAISIFNSDKSSYIVLKENRKVVRKISVLDNLLYQRNIKYNNKNYSIFKTSDGLVQVYIPFDKSLNIKEGEILNKVYYYSVFDYGNIDDLNTLLIDIVKL